MTEASSRPVAVSVVIPVYNRATLVMDAVQSALDCGEGLELEVVVVDDASTDGTWSAVEGIGDPRVRALRLATNSGQSAARNLGLDAARGVAVKFLDSDDVLLPGHLRLEAEAVERGAEIAVSGWASENADGTTTTYPAPEFRSVADDILAGVAVPTSSALYRRRTDWRWDPELRKLDDWDYFCQAALQASTITTVRGTAYVMRHHGGERATDAGMLANAREHHHILRKIESQLDRDQRLTDARKKRLAQYFYKELRVLSLYDDAAFEAAVEHILELDPRFRPRDEERQRVMRLLARALGVRRAVRLHSALKRILRPERR